MKQFSVAGIGVYVSIIEGLLHLADITPEPGSVAQIVNDSITVLGWILIILGQLKRSDLHWGIFRKSV